MTNDELTQYFVTGLTALHENVAALPDGPLKTRAERMARVAHGALEALQDLGEEGGVVQPFDGTNKPPNP
jgi:hypothetical protein